MKQKDLISKFLKPTEDDIQAQVENYLGLLNLRYIHIPKGSYQAVKSVSKRQRGEISKKLTGVPDLLILSRDNKNPENNHLLLLELKKEGGKLSKGQIEWHVGLNVFVAYSFEESKKVIDSWLKVIKKM